MKDPNKEEILAVIPEIFKNEDGFEIEVEVGMYWFAREFYKGQTSNLYKVMCNSQYRPGLAQFSVVGEGALAEEIYCLLKEAFND